MATRPEDSRPLDNREDDDLQAAPGGQRRDMRVSGGPGRVVGKHAHPVRVDQRPIRLVGEVEVALHHVANTCPRRSEHASQVLERQLPAFLRREPLLRVSAGIVARRDHPLQSARPTPGDLAHCAWVDCDAPVRIKDPAREPSLGAVLERLGERAGVRAGPVLRAGASGLFHLARGPWLSWLPLTFLARLPELGLKPLPTPFGRRRYRAGLVARRSAEDLAPVRLFEDIVRDIALEVPSRAEAGPAR